MEYFFDQYPVFTFDGRKIVVTTNIEMPPASPVVDLGKNHA